MPYRVMLKNNYLQLGIIYSVHDSMEDNGALQLFNVDCDSQI